MFTSPESVARGRKASGRRWALALGLAWLSTAALAQEQQQPISPGDLVYVDVYRRPELSATAQVDTAGNIDIPYVGSVAVSGMTETDAAARISAALKTILKNPRVRVSRSAPKIEANARTAEMKTQVIALNNSNAEVLSKALQGMCSQGGGIGADQNSNSVIITDTPAAIQNIMGVITQIDQMPSLVTQVRIESKIAEVKQGAMKDIGIRWFVQGEHTGYGFYPPAEQQTLISPTGQQANPFANEQVGGLNSASSSGLERRFVDGPSFDRRLNVPVQVPIMGQLFLGVLAGQMDIGSLLDALVKDNKAELLASPNILAVNHKQAEIKMTDEFPYTESSATFGVVNYSVKFMDLGIKLLVTPHVYKDANGPYVQMELHPEVSFPNGVSNGVPIRAVRSSDSIANVRDGQTLVIGGIILNDEHKTNQRVPGLGKIPVVGNLFKRKETSKTRNELMVFVTPNIHNEPESVTWDRMINLTGNAKNDLPSMPTNEAAGESRKE